MASKSSAPLFVPRSVMASESAAVRIAGRASSIASVTPLERSFSVIGRMARFANRVADGWLGSSTEPRPSGRAQAGAEVGLVVPRPWYLEPKPQAAAIPRRRPTASTVESSEIETSTALESVADTVETSAPSPSVPTRSVPELPRDLVAAPIAPVRRAEELLELRVRDIVPRPALPTVARRPEQIASPLQAALRHAAWVDTQITQRVQAAAAAVTTVTQRAAERVANVEQAFSYVTPVVPAARPTSSRQAPSLQTPSERFSDASATPASQELVAASEPSSPILSAAEARPPSTPVAPPLGAPLPTPVVPTQVASITAPAGVALVRPAPVAVREQRRDGRVDLGAAVSSSAPSFTPSLGFVAAMPAAFTPAPTPVDERAQTIARFLDRLVAPQLAAIATPRAVVLSNHGRAMAVQREAPELSPIILSAPPAPSVRSAAPRRDGGAIVVSAGAPDPVYTAVASSTVTDSDVGAVVAASPVSSPRSGVASALASSSRPAEVVSPSGSAPSPVAPSATSWRSTPSDELVGPLTSVRPSLARPGAIAARAEEVAIGQALRVARVWGESLTVVSPTMLASIAAVTTGAPSEKPATPRAFSTGEGAELPVIRVVPPARPGVVAPAARAADRAVPLEPSSSEQVNDSVSPATTPASGSAERPAAMPVASSAMPPSQQVGGAAPPTTLFSTTTAGGIAAIGGFISRLLGVQLVRQMAPLPLAAQPGPTVYPAAATTTNAAPTLVGPAARAPLADELTPPPAPLAGPATQRDLVRASPMRGRAFTDGGRAPVEALVDAGRREPVATDVSAASGGPLFTATTEGLTMLRPGGVGLVAEQLAGRVGVRASSLAIEFVDPPTLGQVVSVSRAADLRDTTQIVVAPTAPSPRTLAAGGVSREAPAGLDEGGAFDESMPVAVPSMASPAAGGAFVAAGALPSSAPSPVASSPSSVAAASFARLTRKANTLSADEWALVSVFPSETTAYQVAAARQARSWQRLESRGVDAVFVPSMAEGPAPLSFAAGAPSAPSASMGDGPVERVGSARAAAPFALSTGVAGDEGSPYVVSWTRGQVPSVVPAADQPRLPDGRLPRGGALWPSSASFEPVFELTLPSLTSNAQKVAEAPVGQPLWNVLPSSPVVEGVAWRPTAPPSEPAVEESPQLMTGSASRPGTPTEITGPASRVPSVPVVKTVAPTGSRGAHPTVRPLSRAEREDGDVRPVPGSPEARPALAIIKGGAAGGSVAARGSVSGPGGASGGSSGSSASSSGVDSGAVGVDGQGGVSFRPSSEAAAKLLEAVRSPGAIPQDGRVTMADLTLIAIASTTQQVAAAEEGGGPAAAPAGGDGGGGGGAAGGGKAGGGGGGADITAIAEKVYEAYKRLLEVQRERSGDSWES